MRDIVKLSWAFAALTACVETTDVGFDIERRVTVIVNGAGAGTITFDPPGEPCPPSVGLCADYAAGEQVTVTATPDPASSTLIGWSPTCGGGADCVVSTETSRVLVVSFGLQEHTLDLCIDGRGAGVVEAVDLRLTCTSTACPIVREHGLALTLNAVPERGSAFAGWSGPCATVTAATCVVPFDRSVEVCAHFDPVDLRVTVGTSTVLATLRPAPGAEFPDSCWFTPSNRAVGHTSSETIVISGEHHLCDTRIDRLRAYVAPLGTSDFVASNVGPFAYPREPIQDGEYSRGVVSRISATIEGDDVHVIAPARLGPAPAQPDRIAHAIRRAGEWELVRDVFTSTALQAQSGNTGGAQNSGFHGVLDLRPGTGRLHAFGFDGAWYATTYHAAEATFSEGRWSAIQAVHARTGVADRRAVEATDQAFDAAGRGAQAWVDKPSCSVGARVAAPGEDWGDITWVRIPSSICTSTASENYGAGWNLQLAPVDGGFEGIVAATHYQSSAAFQYHLRWTSAGWEVGAEQDALWTSAREAPFRVFSVAGQAYVAFIVPQGNGAAIVRLSDGAIVPLIPRTATAMWAIDVARTEPRALTWVTRNGVTGEYILRAAPLSITR